MTGWFGRGKRAFEAVAIRWSPVRWLYVVLRTLLVRPVQWWLHGRALRRAAARVEAHGYRVRWQDQVWFVYPSARRPVRFMAEFDDESIPLTLSLERGYFDLDGFTHAPHYEAARKLVDECLASGAEPVRVLDCACGSGHGATILSGEGVDYLGVDVDADLQRYAARRYEAVPGEFLQGDVTDLPVVSDHSLDVFVSIETVEHVDRDASYVQETRRMLKPEGILYLTTPERVGVRHSGNVWHPREYSVESVRDLFSGWRVRSLSTDGGTIVLVAQPPRS